MDEELKCWLVVREDLDIPLGKLATQAGHAYMNLAISLILKSIDSPELRDISDQYFKSGTPKITVKTKNETSLDKIVELCKETDIPYVLVVDEGRNIFDGPTKTCVALGPYYRSMLPKYIQRLQLY